MGVLDLPNHRLFIRELAQDSVNHVEENHLEAGHGQEGNSRESTNPRPRRQRTPKLGRKVYGSHDLKRGKGVRQQRRSENLFFLYSLVDTLNIENVDDADDYDDNHMTAFGELFIDPNKMQVWSEFMSMPEDQQQSYLQDMQKSKPCMKSREKTKDTFKDSVSGNPNFEKISKKIKDYLQTDKLSKESLCDFEEDLVSSMTDFPTSVLVLNIPSSYERMLIHGICQYMNLRTTTHKFKRKCLVEIESEDSSFSSPQPLLSEYLQGLQDKSR
eukprot:gene7910-8765_t